MRRTFKPKRRIRKRKSLLKNKYFWYGTLFLSGATLLFTLFVLSPWLQIQNIQVKGNKIVSAQEIEALAWGEIESNFLVLPTTSMLLLDIAKIAEAMKETFPPVREAQVQRSFPNTLIFSITERETVAVWCSKEQCFSIDEQGILFQKREQSEGFVSLSSLQDPEPVLGKSIIAKDLLSILLDFKREVEEFPEKAVLSFVSFHFVSQEQVEAVTKNGWKVLFSPKENMKWQETKLRLVLEEKIPQEQREDLEYIDLRFGDQAYIKYQD